MTIDLVSGLGTHAKVKTNKLSIQFLIQENLRNLLFCDLLWIKLHTSLLEKILFQYKSRFSMYSNDLSLWYKFLALIVLESLFGICRWFLFSLFYRFVKMFLFLMPPLVSSITLVLMFDSVSLYKFSSLKGMVSRQRLES